MAHARLRSAGSTTEELKQGKRAVDPVVGMPAGLKPEDDLPSCPATAYPLTAPKGEGVPTDRRCKGMLARLGQQLGKVVAAARASRVPLTLAWATERHGLAH